jgi:hypothetical protein
MIKTLGLALALSGIATIPAVAAPFTVNATASIVMSTGSYAGDLSPGTAISVDISLDTDEAAADPAGSITTPSVVPGHEFTSFYQFLTPAFSFAADLIPASPPGDGFNADILGIVVNNDMPLTSAETGGILPDGTYDWIELLGSTTVDDCLFPSDPLAGCAPDEFSPVDGEEWTLGIFADSNWFTDGSVIPDELPASFVTLIVGIDIDEFGEEVGFAFATVDTFSSDLPQAASTAISAPATAGLAGLFLIAAARIRRRR